MVLENTSGFLCVSYQLRIFHWGDLFDENALKLLASMNYIIGETLYKLCRRGFKNNKATKLRKISHTISSLDLILAYFNFQARTRKWFWQIVKMKCKGGIFCTDRVTCLRLSLLWRTTIKAELKQKADFESIGKHLGEQKNGARIQYRKNIHHKL